MIIVILQLHTLSDASCCKELTPIKRFLFEVYCVKSKKMKA